MPFNSDDFWKNEFEIFRFWSKLTHEEQKSLERDLDHISIALLNEQRRLLHEETLSYSDTFEPFEQYAFSGNSENHQKGEKLIKQGRLGCLLLAGGQGTRLHYSGPKGTYPISVIKNKSLFQLCSEKVRAASCQAGRLLKLAIMTSPDNDEETKNFFQQNRFFGLDSSQISFFKQDSLPLLDANGKLFLQNSSQIAKGPDGNGHSLLCFARSGILENWKKEGIEYVHVIVVDNPLADPFDKELLGFHVDREVEITLKCTEKCDPEEKVGLLVKDKGQCRVVEYTEMPDKEKIARKSDGSLKHCCGNLSLFCFSLSFIERMAHTKQFLPLHKAWKAAQCVDDQGEIHFSKEPIAWKFETFIFDWLNFAKKTAALIYPREQCFAPLKNAIGNDSPETVRIALQAADRRTIAAITDLPPPDFPFELDAEFYYPTPRLLSKWKGKRIETPYVEP